MMFLAFYLLGFVVIFIMFIFITTIMSRYCVHPQKVPFGRHLFSIAAISLLWPIILFIGFIHFLIKN